MNIERQPKYKLRTFFTTDTGESACVLKNGWLIELPTHGETDPQKWNDSTKNYLSRALPALEDRNTEFTKMQEYDDGRVQFLIDDRSEWYGWGKFSRNEHGEEIFTLYGGYH